MQPMELFSNIADKISEMNSLLQAQLRNVDINSTFELQTFTIDLTTARTEQDPYIIGFPFKSIAFSDATDNSTYVNVKFNKNDSGISTRKFKDNSSLVCDGIFTKGFLSWPAQSGKIITVTVFVRSRYDSGSLINSGTVSVSTNSAATGPTRTTLSAATAASVAAANASRKTIALQNHTGNAVWFGPSSSVSNTGANQGIEVPDKGILYWSNQAQLYAYSVGGGDITSVEET